MIALLQRVSHASVSVAGETVGQIERGLLVFVGLETHDGADQAKRLLERILNYRVFEDEDGMMVYGGFADFGTLQKYFEDNNIEILSSGFDRIPTTTKELTEEQQEDVNKLLEKLEEDDDVQNVFHTMA